MSADSVAASWVILGASSSIGRAFARRAAETGAHVVLAGRDDADLARTAADLNVQFDIDADCVAFDAAHPSSHEQTASALEGLPRPLGVLVLFGTMPSQAEVDDDFGRAEEMIAVNYSGVISILSRIAPLLEADGEGCIVAMSSVAGDRGRLKNYVYGSTKAGLNAYLQGLRARLWRSGVTVTTVKSGFIDTDMTFGAPGLFLVASPDECAAACMKFAASGREQVYFPWFWRYIMLIIRLIPERIFKKMSI